MTARVGRAARRFVLATLAVGSLVLLLVAVSHRGERPNVLLITVDTLRADRLGCYGYGLAHTPAIDRLAEEGVRCTDAASSAPITLPAHASIMTGLYPPAHGVRDNGNYALGQDALTLAERLRAAGYHTGAFVSAAVLTRRYGLDQGFGVYDDDLWSEDTPPLFMIRERPARRTAERALGWLAGGEDLQRLQAGWRFDGELSNVLPPIGAFGVNAPHKAIGAARNQHGAGPLQVAGDHRGSSGMDDRCFTRDQGGDRQWRADQQHQIYVESVFGKQAHIFGGPDGGLGRRYHGVGDPQFFHLALGDGAGTRGG